jgi:hypothetical protein
VDDTPDPRRAGRRQQLSGPRHGTLERGSTAPEAQPQRVEQRVDAGQVCGELLARRAGERPN